MGLDARKPVGGGGGGVNQGTDQPAQSDQHLCNSLIGKYDN